MDDKETEQTHSGVGIDTSNEDEVPDSGEEDNMEQLMGSLMKGMAKAFSTATANKDRGVTTVPQIEEATVTQQKTTGVAIRVLPNEASTVEERRYEKIAKNGVIRLFELLNQS
ncbi:hypothetical protein BBOV_I004000 [Babesia bovis T2Bo]|uniref:hypothetical protein n=1 Tax=Babesia bovis T2Bo TaxID=484906 RepID=UPI001C368721|nr:hypothetical protein BBOV_I004000 [Babesia bovis T2Bo]EDO05481.2 hypothetical protein BBOV_I004000 [Babesia bovis T2Bo]